MNCTEVVKQETNDDKLVQEIMSSVPYLRKKLISSSLEQKRHDLLDKYD